MLKYLYRCAGCKKEEADNNYMKYYISIEKNTEIFESYKVLWKAHGIDGIRADTMTDGISKAVKIENSENDELFFIDIVADDIDFMPQLKILSAETNAPILIATFNLDYDERHEALRYGADFYGEYCPNPEQNIDAVLSVIDSINQRARKQKAPHNIISHGDILIVIDAHRAFIDDTELTLTNAEMKILYYFMVNRGNTLSHSQIYKQLNTNGYDEPTTDIIYSTVKRLRQKIREITEIDYIETVRDVGYRLRTKNELKKIKP